MAGAATTNYLGVVDSRYGREDNCAVAVFANIRRLHVRRVFADRLGTVVTTDTVTNDVHMIEKHGQPASCAVTVVAGIAARDVSRMFADGSVAIMARATSTDYLGVIDRKYGCPNCRAMAIFANIACLDMRWVLASRLGTVMTADTITNNIDMIKIRRHPGGCDVTVVAGVAAGNVRLVLAGCTYAVMAAYTIANNTKVIENSR
jgi:hypothetical protein